MKKKVPQRLIWHPREEAIARKTGRTGTPEGCTHLRSAKHKGQTEKCIETQGADQKVTLLRMTRNKQILKSAFWEQELVLLIYQYCNSSDFSITTTRTRPLTLTWDTETKIQAQKWSRNASTYSFLKEWLHMQTGMIQLIESSHVRNTLGKVPHQQLNGS